MPKPLPNPVRTSPEFTGYGLKWLPWDSSPPRRSIYHPFLRVYSRKRPFRSISEHLRGLNPSRRTRRIFALLPVAVCLRLADLHSVPNVPMIVTVVDYWSILHNYAQIFAGFRLLLPSLMAVLTCRNMRCSYNVSA